MDVNTLLENETVQGLLKKFGVSDQQARSVANQAMNAIKSKFNSNPKQMSSLLSENPNTADDEKLAGEVEDDFIDRLVKKVGIPASAAQQAKGAFPDILQQISGKLSSNGNNNESGIAGMLGSITDLFDGDNDNNAGKKSKSGGGFMGMFSKLFGK